MSSIENQDCQRQNTPKTLGDYYTLDAINGSVTELYHKNTQEEVSFDDWSKGLETEFRTNWQGENDPSAKDFLDWLKSKQAIESLQNDSQAKLHLVKAA